MDKIDIDILKILSNKANLTATKLSKKVNLSIPAVNKRIQNLKSSGIIDKYTIITNNQKIGKPIIAFVLIILKSIEHTDKFLEYINTDCDILECFAITGEYDCILKVCASSVNELDKKLATLKAHNGVLKSYTMLSLTTHKYSPTILPTEN